MTMTKIIRNIVIVEKPESNEHALRVFIKQNKNKQQQQQQKYILGSISWYGLFDFLRTSGFVWFARFRAGICHEMCENFSLL